MFVLFAVAVLFVLAGIAAALIIGARVNRRITESVDQLSDAAVSMGHGAPVNLDVGPNISEIDAVTKSLRWAYETIHDRALEQERAREEAVEANRAKDRFIATLAHEVRTPLSAISAAAESLERTLPRHETGIINRQVKHLTALVNELFDAARIALDKFVLVSEPLNLTECVHQCIEGMNFDRSRYDVDLYAPQHVWINGDDTRIQQVITNLITNSVKFTPKGGTIRVSVMRKADSAVIEVSDPGIGIPSDLMPKLFELFVQGDRTESSSAGLGIGLSLVRRLVELHGGKVSAFSEGKYKGSTFTVTLPCIEPDIAADRSAAA
jgi:signal transduction histidine kinase